MSNDESNEAASREQVINEIINHQRLVFQTMQSGALPEWLETDLTMPQLKIMFLVNARSRIRMGELAEALGRNLSTTTGVVDRLVEHGLVGREEDPDDRRVVMCKITPRGQELCQAFLQGSGRETVEVLQKLNLEELRKVREGMEIYFQAAFEHANQRLRGSRGHF